MNLGGETHGNTLHQNKVIMNQAMLDSWKHQNNERPHWVKENPYPLKTVN